MTGGARTSSSRASSKLLVALIAVGVAGLVMWFARSAPDAPPPAIDAAAAIAATESRDTANGDLTRAMRDEPDERTVAAREPAPPPSPSTPTAKGTVIVDVYREPVVAVDGVRVVVGSESGVTDANGRVALSVAVGTWRVSIDRTCLPAGLLPPAAQDRLDPGEPPPGFYAREVSVAAAATVNVRLRVFLATSLRGMVVDSAGVAVPDCHVRLQCRAPGLVGVVAGTRTRGDGTYTFADARPGRYDLIANPGFDRVAPLPVRLDVVEGESSVLPTLVVGSGRGSVRGRVVDQDGVPAIGLPVLVYPTERAAADGGHPFGLDATIAWATTDANGRFVLSHLPEAPLTVAVHPMGRLESVESGRQLAQHIPPTFVDLRAASMRDLGDVIAVRSRPFTLAITVIDDEAKIRSANPTLPKKLRASDVFVVKESERNDPALRQELQPAKDGRLSWSCETPHEPVWVIVQRRGFAAREERIEPVPSGTRTLEIRYP